MKNSLMLICAVILVLGTVGIASAGELIVNGNFETGDLTGWNYSGDVAVVNAATPLLPSWLASVQGMDGYFALLGSNSSVGVDNLNQDFTLSQVDSVTLSFNWAVEWSDYSYWGSDTFVALTTYTGEVVGTVSMEELISPFGMGVLYGYYEETFDLLPEWTLDSNMSFTLTELGGRGTNSMISIDNVSVITTSDQAPNATVPEPSFLLLLGIGIGAATLASRRMK